jgi:hypothetical protein
MWDTSMVRTPPANRLIAIVQQVAVSDSFSRADGPLGLNWFPAGSNIDIVSGKAHGTGPGAPPSWAAPTGIAPVSLATGNSQARISLRYRGSTDPNPLITVKLNDGAGALLCLFNIQFFLGVWICIATGGPTVGVPALVDGDILLLEQSDTTYKMYVNGVQVNESGFIGPSDPAGAGIGLGLDTYADNFVFSSPQPVIL